MGERVLQLRCDWLNTLTAPQRLPQNGIDDQSKAFWMASGEHLNRARRELSWLGGKGRFIGSATAARSERDGQAAVRETEAPGSHRIPQGVHARKGVSG
jgi:hypothetical protein